MSLFTSQIYEQIYNSYRYRYRYWRRYGKQIEIHMHIMCELLQGMPLSLWARSSAFPIAWHPIQAAAGRKNHPATCTFTVSLWLRLVERDQGTGESHHGAIGGSMHIKVAPSVQPHETQNVEHCCSSICKRTNEHINIKFKIKFSMISRCFHHENLTMILVIDLVLCKFKEYCFIYYINHVIIYSTIRIITHIPIIYLCHF